MYYKLYKTKNRQKVIQQIKLPRCSTILKIYIVFLVYKELTEILYFLQILSRYLCRYNLYNEDRLPCIHLVSPIAQ